MRTKAAPAIFQVKDATEDDAALPGEFEALVAVFGNVDLSGDRILPGAFAKSIDRWTAAGDPIPIVYSHAHRDPNALLGGVLEAKETDDGLWVRGQLDLDIPAAAAVHRHMKARRLTKFSFAYDVKSARPASKDAGVVELLELDVLEVGPTIIPANPDTDLLGVKQEPWHLASLKTGRVLSAANEQRLRDAMDTIQTILGQLDSEDEKAEAFVQAVILPEGKGPIASHSTSTVDDSWSAQPNVSRASTAQTLRTIHAWVDPDGDPEARSSYRFPHHAVDARNRPGAANVRACIAGIAILNGGRGGTNIPADDRRGVWNHLARHLRDGGMEPAALTSSRHPAHPRAEATGVGALDPHGRTDRDPDNH